MRADVRDADTVRRVVRDARPEVVFHLAAQPLVRASLGAPRETWEVNVIGTLNVLEAVRASDGVRAVVNVTSDKCYENREWEWAYREDEPMGGHDPYSSSKGAAELATARLAAHVLLRTRTVRGSPRARAGNVDRRRRLGRRSPDPRRRAGRARRAAGARPQPRRDAPLAARAQPARRLSAARRAAVGGARVRHGAGTSARPRTTPGPSATCSSASPRCGRGGLEWEPDAGAHAPEARHLKIDASRARARLGWAPRWDLERALAATVEWYAAHAAGEDVRALSLAQLDAFRRAPAP